MLPSRQSTLQPCRLLRAHRCAFQTSLRPAANAGFCINPVYRASTHSLPLHMPCDKGRDTDSSQACCSPQRLSWRGSIGNGLRKASHEHSPQPLIAIQQRLHRSTLP